MEVCTNRKPTPPYEPFFDGKLYVDQLFGVKMVSKRKTIRSLNIIAVNAVLAQVFQTESAPEDPGAHGKCNLREDTRCSDIGQLPSFSRNTSRCWI